MEPSETTIDSLKDDNIEDILLRLPSPASLARAALASSRWRGIASSPTFLRRFRELHPWSPVLGLFVSQTDLEQLPIFHPAASVRSDPDLASATRRGDFLLTRLQNDRAWRFRDCRNGRLLLCRGDSLSVYDPVSHRHVAVPRPPRDDELLALLVQGGAEYISDCLLDGHGEGGAAPCFRVVTVQRDGQRMRAMEYDSCTAGWRIHPWVDGIDVPTQRMRPMHAAAAGLIFWKCHRNSSLVLDTSTMAFSIVALPVALETHPLRPARVYAIGDTEAGACCLLVFVSPTMLQAWLLKKNDGGGHGWELEKQSQIDWLARFNRQFTVHMVAAGIAIVSCASSKFSHFVIDLKDLSLKDKFRCRRSMAFPFQMPWPPAVLVPASTCERSTPQTYACRDAENQHEAPSSSRKRKSNDERASGEETMEPCISIASLQNESSEKKFCYENGPPS